MKKFTQLLTAAAFAVAALSVAPVVQAQSVDVSYVSPGLRTISLFATAITNTTLTAATRQKIPVPAHSIPVVQLTQYAAASGTAPLIVGFSYSLDGTNWGTTRPYLFTNALSGTNILTTLNILGTNIPARFLALDYISTSQANAVTLTNAYLTFFPY